MRALLCFHGLLSTKSDFIYLEKVLRPLYDFIGCYDLPGHGNNPSKFTTTNIEKFLVTVYDMNSHKYDEIDVIGYSMSGVMACYLQSIRKIHKLVLVSPSYRYLNLKNYHYVKKSKAKDSTISALFPRKNYMHILSFAKIMADLSSEFYTIMPATLILWGKEDYLVKEESGELLYKMIQNPNRIFIKLDGHSHFNMLQSPIVSRIIYDFLV